MDYEYRRIAAASHLTPREFIRDFLTILDLKSDVRTEDRMEDFLSGQKGIRMSSSMIGSDDMEAPAGGGKYEGFTL